MGELIDELVVQNYAHSVKALPVIWISLRYAKHVSGGSHSDRDFGWFWPTDDGNPRSARESSIGSRTWSWRCFFLLGGLMGMHVPQGDRQRRYGFFKEFGEFEQQ
jgi:hypothetical protein